MTVTPLHFGMETWTQLEPVGTPIDLIHNLLGGLIRHAASAGITKNHRALSLHARASLSPNLTRILLLACPPAEAPDCPRYLTAERRSGHAVTAEFPVSITVLIMPSLRTLTDFLADNRLSRFPADPARDAKELI